jgi:GNAT superfamily N-acetyltransferase
MRLVGRLSPWVGSLLDFTVFDDFVSGYVWLASGRVVGNLTLQRVELGGIRWRISNVAVTPEYRGRGIARALLQAAIREIARLGGSWAVLQVRADNPIARRFYESAGFTDVCTDGIWKRPAPPAEAPHSISAVTLGKLPVGAWRMRYELAQAAILPLARWAGDITRAGFETSFSARLWEGLGNLTRLYRVERWGVWENDVLMGMVETRSSSLGDRHTLRFIVHPKAQGRLERALVTQGLRCLVGAPGRPVIAEHSGDHAAGVEALEAAGFRAQRVLLTMRRRVTPMDVEF